MEAFFQRILTSVMRLLPQGAVRGTQYTVFTETSGEGCSARTWRPGLWASSAGVPHLLHTEPRPPPLESHEPQGRQV